VALAAAALWIATAALFSQILHHTMWLGPREEAHLQETGLVERETQLSGRSG
jgi:hypothetical protein